MRFAVPSLEMEFYAAHPEAVATVIALDVWCGDNRLPEVVVTDVLRTDDDSERIYFKYANALIARLREGARAKRRLGPKERELAVRLESMSEAGRRKWARARPSWHKCGCAVDVRNRHYSEEQIAGILAFLRHGRSEEEWELLSHDVHSGEHLHIGRKDEEFKRRHEQSMQEAKEGKKC